jgi:hypothetical protein
VDASKGGERVREVFISRGGKDLIPMSHGVKRGGGE